MSEEFNTTISYIEKNEKSLLNSSTSLYDHVERNTKEETMRIADHLKRFEPYRIREIHEEYKKDCVKK